MIIYNFDNNAFDFYELLRKILFNNFNIENIEKHQDEKYISNVWANDLESNKICYKFLSKEVFPHLDGSYYMCKNPYIDICFKNDIPKPFNSDKNTLSVIVPITEMYDTNSIYYDTEDGFINLKLNRNEFAIADLYNLEEYTCKNITDITRINIIINISLV